jgi:hypothetical protein
MNIKNECKGRQDNEDALRRIEDIKAWEDIAQYSDSRVYVSVEDCIDYLDDVDKGLEEKNDNIYYSCKGTISICIEGSKENLMYIEDYE